jgi:hypothetical protein
MGLPPSQGKNMYNLMASHENGRLNTIHILATHVATLALARDQGKGVARLRAYK